MKALEQLNYQTRIRLAKVIDALAPHARTQVRPLIGTTCVKAEREAALPSTGQRWYSADTTVLSQLKEAIFGFGIKHSKAMR